MRIYVPDKRESIISEVLQDLYMLKKAIDYSTGTTDTRITMVDNIRDKLKNVLDKLSKNNQN